MSSRAAGPDVSGWPGRFYRWLLLTGDRTVLVAAFTAATFLGTLLLASGTLRDTPASATSVLRLVSSLAGGLLPFVTLVLTINQLALSMELGSVFHLQRRLDSMREFRRDVADATGRDTCPARPAPLLDVLFAELGERADALAAADDDALSSYGRGLAADVRAVRERLSRGSTVLATLVAAREYDPGVRVRDLDRLRAETAADAGDALEALETLHGHVDVAQKYFWTVYAEDELATLARLVVYTGVVALAAGVALTLGYDSLLALGVGTWGLALVVAVGVTLELLPFVILAAYILRIATVARTSAGFGPFVTDGPGWD
ncbi:MAG: hypothetical protein ABEJ06_03880 [Haloarculaceae archaeon]